jgi:hypothetical protein
MIDATEALHGIYAGLSDAWRTWASDKSIGENPPAVQWIADDLPDTPVTMREVLLKGIELSVAQTGLAVRDHVDSLASAYPTPAIRQAAPETSRWPGTSAFTLARSILEGTALITWLLAGTANDDERARRSARLILWSAHHGTRWANATGNTHERIDTPDYWKQTIEEAGFPVTTVRGQLVVDKPFQHTDVISTAFGDHGKHLYNRWSGAAHHAPWVLTPGTYLRPDESGGGHFMGTSSRLADHVDAAADVSDLLLTSSDSMRTYWGRAGPDQRREEIRAEALQLRVEAAQIRDRDSAGEP